MSLDDPREFVPEDAATFHRIEKELWEAARQLDGLAPAVSIFGSARSAPDSWESVTAQQTARLLGFAGVPIVTGGGPGVMAAANRGANEAGAESVGLNITLPMEQVPNDFLTRSCEFRYFLVRKYFLTRYSFGFALFPGGFGTMDELFELLVLYNTNRTERRPIVLAGTDYWADFMRWLMDFQGARGYIDAEDIGYLTVVDSPREIAAALIGWDRLRDAESQSAAAGWN